MTSEVMLHNMKNVHPNNVTIHRFFLSKSDVEEIMLLIKLSTDIEESSI